MVHEMVDADDLAQFTSVKKLRFAAYICFWFAGLATVVERYQQLVSSGTIPDSVTVSALLTTEFIDRLKPFRNAVAHCSDHDDARVLQLFEDPYSIPDHAAAVSSAFRQYFRDQGTSTDES